MPLLDGRTQDFPGVKFEVKICDSAKVVEYILNGNVDFGFITREITNRLIELEKFAEEEYVLASATNSDLVSENARDLGSRRFVKFPGADILFE